MASVPSEAINPGSSPQAEALTSSNLAKSQIHVIDRAGIFRAFNAARHLAAKGYIDAGRLNRALGVAQRTKPRAVAYITTVDDCTCPDKQYRHVPTCKHQLALMLCEVGR